MYDPLKRELHYRLVGRTLGWLREEPLVPDRSFETPVEMEQEPSAVDDASDEYASWPHTENDQAVDDENIAWDATDEDVAPIEEAIQDSLEDRYPRARPIPDEWLAADSPWLAYMLLNAQGIEFRDILWF